MKIESRTFRIGTLAKKLNVERFVIRFWEKEFNMSPHRSTGKQRFYTEKDLEKFSMIKKLLYEQGFTIAGARKHLKTKIEGEISIIASQSTKLEAEPCAENLCQQTSEQKIDISRVAAQLLALQKHLTKLQKHLS